MLVPIAFNADECVCFIIVMLVTQVVSHNAFVITNVIEHTDIQFSSVQCNNKHT